MLVSRKLQHAAELGIAPEWPRRNARRADAATLASPEADQISSLLKPGPDSQWSPACQSQVERIFMSLRGRADPECREREAAYSVRQRV